MSFGIDPFTRQKDLSMASVAATLKFEKMSKPSCLL
jgi:hypothetical protein